MAKWHPDALLDFMERGLYFDWDGTPVDRDRFMVLFAGDRTVAVDDLGNRGRVSTIFMPMDMGIGWAGAPPLLFETMIFGGPLDGACDRYPTLASARRGHAHWLRILKATPRRQLIHNGGKP
jgi:hypothetical protein